MLPNKLFEPIISYIYYSTIENSKKGAGIYKTESSVVNSMLF
jgi:hypothetical protein